MFCSYWCGDSYKENIQHFFQVPTECQGGSSSSCSGSFWICDNRGWTEKQCWLQRVSNTQQGSRESTWPSVRRFRQELFFILTRYAFLKASHREVCSVTAGFFYVCISDRKHQLWRQYLAVFSLPSIFSLPGKTVKFRTNFPAFSLNEESRFPRKAN